MVAIANRQPDPPPELPTTTIRLPINLDLADVLPSVVSSEPDTPGDRPVYLLADTGQSAVNALYSYMGDVGHRAARAIDGLRVLIAARSAGVEHQVLVRPDTLVLMFGAGETRVRQLFATAGVDPSQFTIEQRHADGSLPGT